MLNINALHLQELEHFQVLNILKYKIAADIRANFGVQLFNAYGHFFYFFFKYIIMRITSDELDLQVVFKINPIYLYLRMLVP